MEKKYCGVIIPALTPLTPTFSLDHAAAERLLEHFWSSGAMSFLFGTTGEAHSLSLAVKRSFVTVAGKRKKAGELLYAGISSNCIDDSIELAKVCLGQGADVLVANLPSYYALTPDQMRRYFETLVEQTNAPLIIYNIPSTTHQTIPLETIDALSQHPLIVGIKDSERNEERLNASLRLWSKRNDFSHFLGWSARSVYSLMNGGDGLVPASGNLDPALYVDIYRLAATGDQQTLQRLQERSEALGRSYQSNGTLGQNLALLKRKMQEQGWCQSFMMPPL